MFLWIAYPVRTADRRNMNLGRMRDENLDIEKTISTGKQRNR